MTKLSQKKCIPCAGGTPPLNKDQQEQLLKNLEGWQVVDGHHLKRSWKLADFKSALALVNDAGAICEQENHHADFNFGWGHVTITLYTHKINGLTESDFIVAAKISEIKTEGL